MREWRAAVSNQASGFCGTPSRGQVVSVPEGVLGSSHIACVRREVGHETAVRLAGYSLDSAMRRLPTTFTHSVILRLDSGESGRTSTAPARCRRAAPCPLKRYIERGEFQ